MRMKQAAPRTDSSRRLPTCGDDATPAWGWAAAIWGTSSGRGTTSPWWATWSSSPAPSTGTRRDWGGSGPPLLNQGKLNNLEQFRFIYVYFIQASSQGQWWNWFNYDKFRKFQGEKSSVSKIWNWEAKVGLDYKHGRLKIWQVRTKRL